MTSQRKSPILVSLTIDDKKNGRGEHGAPANQTGQKGERGEEPLRTSCIDDLTWLVNTIFEGAGQIFLAVEDGTGRWRQFAAADPQVVTFLAGKPEVYGAGLHMSFAQYRRGSRRRRADVTGLRAFVHDVDCGKEGAYATAGEALKALLQHFRARRLPVPTAIVQSGGGLHLYWVLKEAVSVEKWLPAARWLRERIREVDPKLAKDLSKVATPVAMIRVPCSVNGKYDPPRPVRVLSISKRNLLSLEAFGTVEETAQAQTEHGPDVHPEHLFRACPLMQAAYHLQDRLDYNGWWLTLQLCAFAKSGRKLAHLMSRRHPSYDPEETEAKFDEALRSKADGVGPVTCERLRMEIPGGDRICAKCKFAQGVKSPVSAARQLETLHRQSLPVTSVSQEGRAERQPSATCDAKSAEDQAANRVVQTLDELRLAKNGDVLGAKIVELINARLAAHTGGISYMLSEGMLALAGLKTAVSMRLLPFPVGKVEADGNVPHARIAAIGVQGERIVIKKMVDVPLDKLSSTQSLAKYMSQIDMVPSTTTVTGKALVNMFIASAQVAAELDAPAQAITRFGYDERRRAYCIGEWTFDGETEATTLVEGSAKQLLSRVSAKGSARRQREIVRALIPHMTQQAQLAMLVSAGSMLAHMAADGGGVYNISGPTGSGKSALMSICTSFFGPPMAGFVQARDTRNAFEAKARTLRHLPLLFDEITTNVRDNRYVEDIVYSVVNGQPRDRATVDGSLRHTESRWNLFMVSTSNRSLLASAEGADVSDVRGALRMRIIEVRAEKLFTTMDSDRFFSETVPLLRELSEHYGHIGRDLARLIVARYGAVKQKVLDLRVQYEQELGHTRRYQAFMLACAEVMGELLEEVLGMRHDFRTIIGVMRAKLKGQQEMMDTIEEAMVPKDARNDLLAALLPREDAAIFDNHDPETGGVGAMTIRRPPSDDMHMRIEIFRDKSMARIYLTRTGVERLAGLFNLSVQELVQILRDAGMLKGVVNYKFRQGVPDRSGLVQYAPPEKVVLITVQFRGDEEF